MSTVTFTTQQEAAQTEPMINRYSFISNTRLLHITYDQKEESVSIELSCLGLFSNTVLCLTIQEYSEQALNKFLSNYGYKDEISTKAKGILDRFPYYSFVNTAKFMSEKDFEDLVRAEVWPNFNYTKTNLAKASHYLPRDDKGNYVVDISVDIEDLAFYKSVLECEKLLNN